MARQTLAIGGVRTGRQAIAATCGIQLSGEALFNLAKDVIEPTYTTLRTAMAHRKEGW